MTSAVNVITLEAINLVDVSIKTGFNTELSFNGSSFDYAPSGIFWYAGRYFNLTRKNEEPPYSYDGNEHAYEEVPYTTSHQYYLIPMLKFKEQWNEQYTSTLFSIYAYPRIINEIRIVFHQPYNIPFYSTQAKINASSSMQNSAVFNSHGYVDGDAMPSNNANADIIDPLVKADITRLYIPMNAFYGYDNSFDIPDGSYDDIRNAELYVEYFKPTFHMAFYVNGQYPFAELGGIWRGTEYTTDGNTMLSETN